jgi:hypothetical protein
MNSDVIYNPQPIELQTKKVIYPNISEKQITLNKLIENEITKTESRPTIITPVDEVDYTPPERPQTQTQTQTNTDLIVQSLFERDVRVGFGDASQIAVLSDADRIAIQ